MNLNNTKVLVGMSGGIDSSVAAALLLEQGYNVIGVTIEPFYFYEYYKNLEKQNPKGNIHDAKEICDKLGIQHIVVDYFDYFKENIVNYFIDEYMKGRTPNPCAKCNPLIKWGKLIQTADEYNAQYIATGHYANIYYDNKLKRYILKQGEDKLKDQSYFLWGLSQEQLSRTLLPLGKMVKPNVRKYAEIKGFKSFNKSDSQEVCFIADNNYHNFLKQSIPDIDSKIGEGNIIFRGRVIGRHKGYPFYTIGQRKGIGITYKDALYVKKINAENNTIEVDTEGSLFSNMLLITNVNYVKYKKINQENIYMVKIRYKDKPAPANCSISDNGGIIINFTEEKRAITPGQSAVIYEGEDVVAGGIICN